MGLQDGGQGEVWIPSESGDFESIALWDGGELNGVPKFGWVAILGEGLGWL